MSAEKMRLAHDILGVSALVTAVATSYGILANPAVGLTGIWSLLVPSIQFLAAVLIKLLIIFYSIAILSGLLQPGRILKFGAKIPGFEFNNELAQIDEAVGKLGETERNYDLIANLNEMILDYVASPFEGSILNSTDPAEEIRQQTRQVLLYSVPKPSGGQYPRCAIHGRRSLQPWRSTWHRGTQAVQPKCRHLNGRR